MTESRKELKDQKPLEMKRQIRDDQWEHIEQLEEKKPGSGFTFFKNYMAGSLAQSTKYADKLTENDYAEYLAERRSLCARVKS